MSFLAPLFILGGLAIVGPIVFHLIRRTTREATSFSSLMFLTASPPRVTRRSRLENLWLLLLRCLVLALLALGFGRPFWRTQAEDAANRDHEGKRTAILLDLSASMRRENLWDEARRKAQALLQKAAPGDQVALLAFDDRVRTILDFEEWKKLPPETRAAAAGARLASLSPGWGSTRLDAALMAAGELFLEPGAEHALPGEIVVISDLQEGARLEGLQAYEWPRGVRVTLDRVAAHQLGNAGLQWLSETEEVEKNEDETPIRVRVSNAAEAKREQLQVQWHDLAGAPAEAVKLDVYVPAGQTRVIKAPKPPDRKSAALVLTGDEVDFDNTLYILPPQPLQTPLLFIGTDAPEDPHASLYYLRRAFPKTPRQNVEIIAHASADAVPEFQLGQAQFAVIGDGASEKALETAREFARSGKIVLVPLTSASAATAVAQLLGIPEFSAPEAAVKDYALFAQIDFQHPFFASFADPRFSDFTKIHFWKYRKMETASFAGARVPARFENGDPAIVQVPLGKGSVVIFASSWRPVDSQLALSSKFVPLLQTLLEQSSMLPVQKAQYFVGDEIALSVAAQPLSVKKPDGSTVEVVAGAKFTSADQPGVYSVEPGGRRFVVNLMPEESRTTPLAPERLEGLGVPLNREAAASSGAGATQHAQAQAAEIEGRQKLWRWLVLAALATLLLETLIATKLSRQTANPQYSPI